MSGRPSALRAIALALVTAQLGALAHGALARHLTADSGAVIDACPLEHAQAWAAGAALRGRDDAPGHQHGARHCTALTFLRALERTEPAAATAPLPQGVPTVDLPRPTRRARSSVAVLRLAPKASPPARCA